MVARRGAHVVDAARERVSALAHQHAARRRLADPARALQLLPFHQTTSLVLAVREADAVVALGVPDWDHVVVVLDGFAGLPGEAVPLDAAHVADAAL